MKKLLFDLSVCQPVKSGKYHGGGVYGYIVFKGLVEKLGNAVVAYYNKKRFLDEEIGQLITEKKIEVYDGDGCSIVEAAEKSKAVVFYSPLYSKEHLALLDKPIKGLVTIHGLRNLEMNRDKYEYLYQSNISGIIKCLMKQTPYYHKLENQYWKDKERLFNSRNFNIVTISEHSKSSILYHYPSLLSERINIRMSPSSSINDYDNIQPYNAEKYYLIISAGRWIKNAYRAMCAFQKLTERLPGFEGKLYVVGLPKTTAVYKKFKNNNRIVFFDYVDRPTLESLYKGAYAFLYPTLNEGLGDPPIEAMKYGTPVITSSFGAVSEVCGEAVLYANPYSVEEIAMRIISLEDKVIYEKYKFAGLNKYVVLRKRQDTDFRELLSDIIKMLD